MKAAPISISAAAAVLLVLAATARPVTATAPADVERWTPASPAGASLVSRIHVPRGAWVALAAGGILAQSSPRRENADRSAAGLDRSFLDGPADMGRAWGSGLCVGSTAAGLLGVGLVAKAPVLREAGRDLGTAFVATSAVVLPTKALVRRSRSNGAPYSFF